MRGGAAGWIVQRRPCRAGELWAHGDLHPPGIASRSGRGVFRGGDSEAELTTETQRHRESLTIVFCLLCASVSLWLITTHVHRQGRGVPDPHGFVARCGGQLVAVGTKGHGSDSFVV